MNLNLVTFTDYYSINLQFQSIPSGLVAYFSCHATMFLDLEALQKFSSNLDYL